MITRGRRLIMLLGWLTAAACTRTTFVDGPGDAMRFRGVDYFGQTALLAPEAGDLSSAGVATDVRGYAADTQVLALEGVDPAVAVVMRAKEGAGGPYLLFTIQNALASHRYDAIPGLCAHVPPASKVPAGCD